MPTAPSPAFATVATVQAAITLLLQTREPVFQGWGRDLFVGLVTMMIVGYGIKVMLAHARGLDDQVSGLVFLLFKACGVYAVIVFYEAPIPGVGVSFTNLITDSCAFFMTVLDARSLENTSAHLDELMSRFVVPGALELLANLMYWAIWLLIQAVKALSLAVVAFGLIASAVAALIGPLFVPWLMVPSLSWLFWGWLRAFIQYSFIPVVAMAYLMIFERFIYAYVTTVPPGITPDLYPLYAIQAMVVVGTFAFGIVIVPYLAMSFFSGHAHAGTSGLLAAGASAWRAR
jgi:hypothetical protein